MCPIGQKHVLQSIIPSPQSCVLLDFQKKQPDDESTPSTSNSQSDLFSGETNSDNSNTSLSTQTVNSNQQLSTELNVTSPSKEKCKCKESKVGSALFQHLQFSAFKKNVVISLGNCRKLLENDSCVTVVEEQGKESIFYLD